MPTQTLPRKSGTSISLRESVAQELAGLRPGQLRKVRDFIRFLRLGPLVNKIDPDQAYFWTPEWQEKERAAAADIAAGRVHEYDTVDELRRKIEGNA